MGELHKPFLTLTLPVVQQQKIHHVVVNAWCYGWDGCKYFLTIICGASYAACNGSTMLYKSKLIVCSCLFCEDDNGLW